MCNVSTAPGWVLLPAVDQAGFITPDTHVGVTGWTYLVTVKWTEEDGSTHTESGSIQCFANQTAVYTVGTSGVLVAASTYPVGGIALSGWVDTYAHLPAGLGAAQAGATYMVQSDGRMYVWSGSAWPTIGQGFAASGPAGPTGAPGSTGPANSLTVGSIVVGTPIGATITGTPPNQTLNLVLPEGHWWTGTGAPGTITAALDGDIYFDNSGTGSLYQLQSGTWVSQGSIKGPSGPQGTIGLTGPANSLAIGTVANGGSAAATITGTAPTQTLNLTLPQGPTGATGGTGPSAPDATASVKGIIQLTGDLGGTAASPTVPGLAAKLNAANPTAVKTSAYTAAPGDLIPVDATSAAFTVTLPTAPADKSRVTFKKIDASVNAVTLAAGGSDVFNKTGGLTTLVMALQNTSVTVQYAASTAIWYAVVNDTPMSALDGRYAPLVSPALTGPPTAPTAPAGTNTTQLATTAYVASNAPLASPALTGTPTVPTATAGTSTTQAASTAFVATSYAPLASPALSGTPTVPTASAGTNTTQAATTAFVQTACTNTGGTTAMQASKTTAYTAVAGDFVPSNAVSAGFTVTLPTTPANGARVAVMKTDTSTNAVTIAAGGSDVINAAGTTQLKLVSQYAVASLEYASAAATWYNQESGNPCKFTWLVQSGTRATGYGDMPEGIYFDQAASIWVRWRSGTADASGSNTVALYSNTTNAATGTAVTSGSATLTATSAGATTSWLGPFSIAAATYLQTNVTAAGTTPGARLYMDVTGVYI
jgi:hypothetical protein